MNKIMTFENWFGSEIDNWMVELGFRVLIEWNFEVLDTQILIEVCLRFEISLNMVYTWFRTCRIKFEWNWMGIGAIFGNLQNYAENLHNSLV